MFFDYNLDEGVDTVAVTDRISIKDQVSQLVTYQSSLRLRHLTQISGRNLVCNIGDLPTPPNPLPTCQSRIKPQIGFFSALKLPKESEPFYVSEILVTKHPCWNAFDLSTRISPKTLSFKAIIVEIWYKHEDRSELVTSWGINFNGLALIGSTIPYNNEQFSSNTIFLKLHDLYYTSADCRLSEDATTQLRHGFSLSMSETKPSYTIANITRLHSLKRAHKQQEEKCNELREVLEMKGVAKDSKRMILTNEAELTRIKVALLREQLETEIETLRSLKLSADNLDSSNQDKGLELLSGYENLNNQVMKARSSEEQLTNDHQSILQTLDVISARRQQLIRQLPQLFPIAQDKEDRFFICGVHLPDAKNYDGIADVKLSVALGYVAHLLCQISVLMSVPLRYPIKLFGSQSSITDTTCPQLENMSREFPLYTRGKEREKLHFEYGVFLLNKNVAQLRWYFNLPTSNLRATLPNLGHLLNELSNISFGEPKFHAHVPDVFYPPVSVPSVLKSEIQTPDSLLKRQHLPRLPLSHTKCIPDVLEMDYNNESFTSLRPYINSISDFNELQTADKLNHSQAFENTVIRERILSNGISLSLDQGLNKLSIADQDLLKEPVEDKMTDLTGSEPNLSLIEKKIDSAEMNPIVEEQTAELLKSWHEGETPIYKTASMEEVGEECTETFMNGSGQDLVKSTTTRSISKQVSRADSLPSSLTTQTDDSSVNSTNDIYSSSSASNTSHFSFPSRPLSTSTRNLTLKLNFDLMSEIKKPPPCQIEDRNSDPILPNKSPTEEVSSKSASLPTNSPPHTRKVSETQSFTQVEEATTEDRVPSLTSFGITEDMFLDDVASRTAALANRMSSFKMSFSPQNTYED